MERLYALALLWAYGFCSKEQFNSVLDEIFLSDKGADRDILLELEQCSGSDRDTLHRLFHYFTYEVPPEDVDLFGKTFFSNLRAAYDSDRFNIRVFANRCYSIWNLLPGNIAEKQPFFTMNYVDDFLSFGEETQARSQLESAMSYYDEKED